MEETLIKKYLFSQGGRPSEQAIKTGLEHQLVHLAIPKQGYLPKYLAWVKKAMKSAIKLGEVLKIVLGIFIDEDCTPGGLYNTDDSPLFDTRQFPWAKAFTMVESPSVLFHFDRNGNLAPAVDAFQGKKLLLVDLDSRFDCQNTLPQPGTAVLGGQDAAQLHADLDTSDLQEEYEILVSVPEGDPRRAVLIREFGAAVYRKVDKVEVLVVPFLDQKEAQNFVKQIAANPDEVYCMPKVSLYDLDTLTLTCKAKSAVSADELYKLLQATAVMPIGHDRYRFTTNMQMLDVAQVLYRQNRYVKGDMSKFRALRSDRDRYVILTKKMPRRIGRYYRRVVTTDPEVEVGKKFWYKISNVPRGYSDDALKGALKRFEWWPKFQTRLIDRRDYFPSLWMALDKDLDLPSLFHMGGRPCVLLPDDAPPPGCTNMDRREEVKRGSILGRMERQSVGVGDSWVPTQATKAIIHSQYSKRNQGPRPAEDEWTTVVRSNRGSKAKQKAKQGAESKHRSQTKTTVKLGAKANQAPRTQAKKASKPAVSDTPVPLAEQKNAMDVAEDGKAGVLGAKRKNRRSSPDPGAAPTPSSPSPRRRKKEAKKLGPEPVERSRQDAMKMAALRSFVGRMNRHGV